ncbi:hypothetical protein UCRPC4_g06625 [Phaeomoniella chlamydospora]|uniref:Uncharacterized protein n=1 Tax=Phaeomoniella chlamydospora TaxID=158046 RepID=A0A0G2DVF9_PHACM|nr:hypothetical protein UCRPC4_g06625 [Phaeomoniella chlamydospora]
MGGHVFPKYDTPRMPPDVYQFRKLDVLTRLKDLFVYAETPAEGPGKKDFGDIDVIVCQPRGFADREKKHGCQISENDAENDYVAVLAYALDAMSCAKNGRTTHLAIPWSKHEDGLETTVDGKEGKAIQVDISVVEDIETYHWLYWRYSHGNLFVLINAMIQPYGLQLTDHGLFLGIEELEKQVSKNRLKEGKKAARLFLSKSVQNVTEFLGVPEVQTKASFDNLQQMFETVSKCCFFNPTESVSNVSDSPVELKEKPRNRCISRELIKRLAFMPDINSYFTDFLPSAMNSNEAPGAWAHLTRLEVVDEACKHFEKKRQYETALQKGLQEIGTAEFKEFLDKEVRLVVETDLKVSGESDMNEDKINQKVARVKKGMKQWVFKEVDCTDRPEIEGVADAAKAYQLCNFPEVTQWFYGHWKELEEAIGAIQKVQYIEWLRKKGKLHGQHDEEAPSSSS